MQPVAASAGPSEARTGAKRPALKPQYRLRELTIVVSVVLAVGVFGVLNPKFFDLETAVAILENAAPDGLILIGMTVVIVCGAFDMSVGSVMAFCGLAAAWAMKHGHLPVPLGVATALAAGGVIGWTNGAIITRLKVNPFIATLGTMSVVRGLVQVITRSSPLTGFPDGFLAIAWGKMLTIHAPGDRSIVIRFPVVLLLVAILVSDVLLRKLRYLRQTYFIGSNEEAARLTGIATASVKTFAFTLTGILAGMAGVVATSRTNAIDANAGMGAELRVIAAVIVGGASLSGGRGTILGSFLGLLLMQIITTGLVFVNLAAEAQLIAVGIVLILAAIIDRSGTLGGLKKLAALLFKPANKRMERILNIILVVALLAVIAYYSSASRSMSATRSPVAGAAGVAGQTAASGQRYLMISAATGSPYWIDSKAGLRDKAQELGVSANFIGPPTVDVNQQIDEVKRAIAQKVDGIIMVPMADSVTPAIDEAIAAGIPVVCADADAPSSKRYSFVGTGNYNAGYQGGQELAKLLQGRGEVALLTIPGADNLAKRIKGYQDALAQWPEIKIVQIGNDHGSQTEAEKECRALLQAHPDLAGFGCVAAAGGQGAGVAVKQAGKVGKVRIVAMDRDAATLEFIREGVIDASIAQRTYTMSYLALQMLYDLRNARIKFADDWQKIKVNPLPPNVDTGSFVITRQNVDYFRRQE
jgi:ribose/xylose/arabinose/galactoside ABC-type transport system permease subunit/ABC-type sugar transport system substrate-binding protein